MNYQQRIYNRLAQWRGKIRDDSVAIAAEADAEIESLTAERDALREVLQRACDQGFISSRTFRDASLLLHKNVDAARKP